MRTVILLLLLVACGGSSTNGPSNNPGSGSGNNSAVVQWTFAAENTPVATTVAVGTQVTWHNGDNTTHTVVPDGTPPPANFTLGPGATSAVQTFSTPGTYAYHCSIHPTMRGSLTVQ